MIEYIEASEDALLLGKNHTPPKFGGAPAKDMPFRSETFLYKKDDIITDARRVVN